ncbi:MAG TPA: DUF4157 domain-containing protein [Actinoplanes sp.]|nr:DUF4157 domain-containing protein [Actinoplanes sp.]
MRTHRGRTPDPAADRQAAAPAPRPDLPLLNLQRAAGNQVVESLLAQRRADHRHGAGCGHGEEFTDPEAAQRAVGDVLRSGGQALSGQRKERMETTFEAELSGVREFTGPLAQRATSLLNADAFTVGQNIVYGRRTPEIEAHEMTHAVEPMSESATDLGGGFGVTSPRQDGERRASENGRRVAAGGPSLVTGGGAPVSGGTVQRMGKDRKGKSKAAPEPEVPVETPLDAALRQIAERVPGFETLPRNARIDLAEELGILVDGAPFLSPGEDGYEDAVEGMTGAIAQSAFGPGFQTAGAGSSDWASGQMSQAAGPLRESAKVKALWGDKTTLHHKISRSTLDRLLTVAQANRENAKSLFAFIERMKATTGATSEQRVLWNMPANLELGAASDTRIGDPGSNFDGNPGAGGRMTPRSNSLLEADRLIQALPDNPTAEQFQAIVNHLQQAQDDHEATYGDVMLSDPQVDQWTKGKGGKWKRDN